MGQEYIKFPAPSRSTDKSVDKNIFLKLLTIIIPKANPDFDKLIDSVTVWLVEINGDTKLPIREVGLDKTGQVVVVLPWRDNCGYWTDNNLTLDDFKKHFVVTVIDQTTFDNLWDKFINVREPDI